MEEVIRLHGIVQQIIKENLEEKERLENAIISSNAENERLIAANKALLNETVQLKALLNKRFCLNCDKVKQQRESPVFSRNNNTFNLFEKEFANPGQSRDVEVMRENLVDRDDDADSLIAATPYGTTAPFNSFTVLNRKSDRSKSDLCKRARIDRTVLVPESPERSPEKRIDRELMEVPETMPQIINETTPQKGKFPNHPVVSISYEPATSMKDVEREKDYRPLRLVDQEKLMSPSPDHNSQQLTRRPENSPLLTPKRKRSPKKVKSPWKTRSPRQKRTIALKKTHRIEAEISLSGVRKLTQTQLNVDCFRKSSSQETIPSKVNKLLETPSPSKCKEEEFLILESPPGKKRNSQSSPLKNIENSPDLNETNLSLTALQQISKAAPVKQEIPAIENYDRVLQMQLKENKRNKNYRKVLPGQTCQKCCEYYEAFGEAGQRMIDRCSKHRTRNEGISYTPDGFWNPIISEAPGSPLEDGSLVFEV